MNLSELFIRRPVTTTLIMLGILLFGLMAYHLLPVSVRDPAGLETTATYNVTVQGYPLD